MKLIIDIPEKMYQNAKEDLLCGSELIVNAIKNGTPLEQEPKTGHWITSIKSDSRDDYWPTNPKCSECGGEPYYNNTIYSYKFCPFCGAKMKSEEESEDI